MFQIKAKDGLARVGELNIRGKKITTPTIAVVVNPNKMTVPIKDLKDFDLIITNSYIIKSSKSRKEIEKKGLHKFFRWNKPIYTDSGTFQMYSIGDARITNEETLEFQKKIRSDIITPLDVFTFPDDDYTTAKRKLEETFKRIEAAKEMKEDRLLCQPIQGGKFLDLRKKACSKVYGDIAAIGGIVPLMENYNFKDLVDIIMTCKMSLPQNIPIHAFGAGNPQIFALLVAMGVDIFDSAAYALYASRGAYMTIEKIIDINELKEMHELPCTCDVCKGRSPSEMTEELIARHNLNVTLDEIRKIRVAIKGGRFFEFLVNRARLHADIYSAYIHLLKKYGKFMEEFVSLKKKKAPHFLGMETKLRPDVKVALRLYKERVGSKVNPSFKEVFPFNMLGGENVFKFSKKEFSDMKRIEKLVDFQFGKGIGKKVLKGAVIEKSRKTGRIRRILKKGGVYATIRPGDGRIVFGDEGMRDIFKLAKDYYVKIDEEAVPFVKKGKSVFCKFVKDVGSFLAGDQVAIVDEKGEYIGNGDALLSPKEIMDFDSGVAVVVRKN